jgi:predicted HicB family RNase H-like nuclease
VCDICTNNKKLNMVGAPSREGGRKYGHISVRIEPAVKRELKRLAFDYRLSLSEYLQQMVYRELAEHGRDNYHKNEDHGTATN